MAELELSGLDKRYGDAVALASLDLNVADGELLTLLGPSGSGKTTALRLVAGFLQPDAGRIRIAGRDVTELPPERRDVGMVFQSYALFPHRSVRRNVAFGLERRSVSGTERDERVERALARVRLAALGARMPSELSGGQQQRVALARALVIEPTLLLLDEPLSNLDAGLRRELRGEIREIQRELGITTLLVTHDQEEALGISDRIAVLHEGRVQQIGAPDHLYRHPSNRFVAEFLGKINLFDAERLEPGRYRLAGGPVVRAETDHASTRVLVGVRPEGLRLAASHDENTIAARLVASTFLGELTEQTFETDFGATLRVRTSEPLASEPGAPTVLGWSVDQTLVIPD